MNVIIKVKIVQSEFFLLVTKQIKQNIYGQDYYGRDGVQALNVHMLE